MIVSRFLAIMQKKPIDSVLFTERIQQMCHFFRSDEKHGWELHIACASNVALAYIAKTGNTLRTPLCYKDESGMYLALQVPIGVPSYFPKDAMYSGKYLKDIWDTLPKNPHMARSICPPQAFIKLQKDKNTLNIFTDWLGIMRVYEQQHPHMHVWTNFVPMLPFVTRVPLRADPEGWANYAGWRTFIKDTNPYADTQELRHGSFHIAIGKSQEVHAIPYVSEIFDLKTDCIASPKDYQQASSAIISFIEDISFCVDGPLSVDLSGGRDTRVAAAHAIASGIDCTFRTVARPKLEGIIATKLIDAVGLQNRHDVNFPTDDSSGRQALFPKGKDIAEHNRNILLSNFCGTPSGSYSFDSDTIIPKTIKGATGELVQANGYSMAMFNKPQGVLKNFMPHIIFMSLNPFCSAYTKNVCIQIIKTYIDATANLKSKLTDFYLYDYCMAFNILKRVYVADNNLQDGFSYVYLYDYVQAGFAMPIPDKIETSFMRNLTEQVMPQWKGIPYFHEIAKPEENRYFTYLHFWENEQALANVLDIISGKDEYEEWYNIDSILKITTNKPPATYANVSDLVFCSQATMRLCRHIAHDKFLQEINSQIVPHRE